jgi:glycosyltransferase 2 family protein
MTDLENAIQNSHGVPPTQASKRGKYWLVLRFAVVIAILFYLFSVVSFKELLAAFSRITFSATLFAIGLGFAGLVACTFRWSALLAVYGASTRPTFLQLLRLHLVGLFFNMFVPGGVGGDVVRGVATRDAFREEGTTGALTVVLVERAAGLVGLLILATSAFSIHPLPGVGGGVRIWALVGLLIVIAVVFGVAMARRFGGILPGPLKRIALSLPEIHSLRPFILVLALSVVSHVLVSFAGHLLVSSTASQVTLADSMVVVPLAVGAAFFPLTVAGVGAREAAFVILYAKVGVSQADALAGSLSLLFCQMVLAASGGLIYLLYPLNGRKRLNDSSP